MKRGCRSRVDKPRGTRAPLRTASTWRTVSPIPFFPWLPALRMPAGRDSVSNDRFATRASFSPFARDLRLRRVDGPEFLADGISRSFPRSGKGDCGKSAREELSLSVNSELRQAHLFQTRNRHAALGVRHLGAVISRWTEQ